MSRLVTGWDTETTGIQPGDHRFVEVAVLTYDLDTEKLVDSFVTLIDPQRSIPAETTRIHGIDAAKVAGAPFWTEIAPELHKRLSGSIFSVAHNGEGFDLPFANYELGRIRMPKIETPLVDTMLHGRCTTPYGAVPNLRVFCEALGVPYDPALAHRAEYDVDVMMRAFFNGRRWGAFRDLPEEMTIALAA